MKADLENGEHYVLLEIHYIYIYIYIGAFESKRKVSSRWRRFVVRSRTKWASCSILSSQRAERTVQVEM